MTDEPVTGSHAEVARADGPIDHLPAQLPVVDSAP